MLTIISTNALSLFLLKYDKNGFCNRNIHSIKYLMHSDDPDGNKFKNLCTDFPNLALIIKTATPGEIQVTFDHAPIGKNSLGETTAAFYHVGYLESLMVVSVNAESNFASAGKISTSRSLGSSLEPPSGTSHNQRSCGIGCCCTPSSFRHYSPRRLSWTEKHR